MQNEEYNADDVYLEPAVEVSSSSLDTAAQAEQQIVVQICTTGC